MIEGDTIFNNKAKKDNHLEAKGKCNPSYTRKIHCPLTWLKRHHLLVADTKNLLISCRIFIINIKCILWNTQYVGKAKTYINTRLSKYRSNRLDKNTISIWQRFQLPAIISKIMQNLFLMETVRKNIKAKAVLKNILMNEETFGLKRYKHYIYMV